MQSLKVYGISLCVIYHLSYGFRKTRERECYGLVEMGETVKTLIESERARAKRRKRQSGNARCGGSRDRK